MQILLINPNTTSSMTDSMVVAAQEVAGPGTEIIGATVDDGVPFIDGFYDEALAAAGVARCILERRGTFDAAIIGCFGDPGLYASRELTDAPVIGIAEASFSLAMSLGHRFGVVATLDRGVPGTIDLLRHYGIESRCASIEASGAEVVDLGEDPLSALAQLEEAGRRAVAGGAEVLCLGCGLMLETRAALEERLGVPVVEGVPAAVVLAESLVRLGLRTSKIRAFQEPATVPAV
ncbi:MAG: allantoin racemase [Gaiellales bacterium]|jgi:allantoin racemase|nr:allantoin racemase [Gaiellales bacterium]MDX6592563.1 allantoin racemase [Gaiellales bacterium]